jgi:soluble lytic murein transglycosylase-like protein
MRIIKVLLLAIVIFLASFFYQRNETQEQLEEPILSKINWNKPSVKMYFAVKKYSAKYKVPERMAFSLAYQESRYQGPNHLAYVPEHISPSGALGPMQIMPGSARRFVPGKFSEYRLLHDIEYNVETSMRMLSFLRRKYGSWERAAGAYNTGQPIINGYSIFVTGNKFTWKK